MPFFGAFGAAWRRHGRPLERQPARHALARDATSPALLERSGLVVLGTCPFCTFVLLPTPTCIARSSWHLADQARTTHN